MNAEEWIAVGFAVGAIGLPAYWHHLNVKSDIPEKVPLKMWVITCWAGGALGGLGGLILACIFH